MVLFGSLRKCEKMGLSPTYIPVKFESDPDYHWIQKHPKIGIPIYLLLSLFYLEMRDKI